jgi:hypothetical protein
MKQGKGNTIKKLKNKNKLQKRRNQTKSRK